MKKMLLLTLSIFVVTAVSASATTCGSDPLSTYDASGFTCTLGDLTFSDFAYAPNGSGNVAVPSDLDVSVMPETTVTETGLEFSANWAVTPGQVEHPTITFDVVASSPNDLTDAELDETGSFTGVGSANVTEDTASANLFTAYQAGFVIPTDSATFPPVGSLAVSSVISLVGGSGPSSAQVTNLSNLFSTSTMSTVPEPSLVLLCLCALGLVPLARRKSVRRKFIH